MADAWCWTVQGNRAQQSLKQFSTDTRQVKLPPADYNIVNLYMTGWANWYCIGSPRTSSTIANLAWGAVCVCDTASR